jgi:hypothetical protein
VASQRLIPALLVFLFASGALTIRNRLILGTLIAYGVAAAVQVVNIPTVAIQLNTDLHIETAAAYETKSPVSDGAVPTGGTVEATVRAYFKDIPIMIRIAWCESHFEHTLPGGAIMRGRVNPFDVGVMQINERYHSTTAARLGLDLLDLQDNLAYARYLYEHQGTQPWNASRACWQQSTLAMR